MRETYQDRLDRLAKFLGQTQEELYSARDFCYTSGMNFRTLTRFKGGDAMILISII